MTIELKLLIWSVALAFAQMLVAVAGATLEVGLPLLLGNRENLPKLTGWAGRAGRAHYDMLENLTLFASLVIVAQLAGRTNSTTAYGAEIFFAPGSFTLSSTRLASPICERWCGLFPTSV
jgi:uncharacterized MAPEG superfamily protein